MADIRNIGPSGVFVSLILLANGFCLGVIFYWALFEANPEVTVQSAVWRNSKREASLTFKAGQIAYYSRTVCSDKTVQTRQGRKIVSNDGLISVPLSIGVGELKTGCTYAITVGVPINAALPPGLYKYVVALQMDVNPIRTVTIFLESPPIEVTQ